MDLGIRDRVALVAASTGGLGLAVAEALAKEGARVIVTGRDEARCRAVAERLPGAVARKIDLSRTDDLAASVNTIASTDGPIDILVTNGPGPRPALAAELSTEAVREAVDGLLSAPQQMISAALPGMLDRGWGRILAIGSSGVVAPIAGLAASNTARAALAAYLKTLAAEVADRGVTANLLLPGRIATDRVASLDEIAAERRGIAVEAVQAESRAAIPLGRYGRPAEFAAAAAFLCSEPASYITGVALRCDGGLVRSL
ncbi:SDR family oxidoreductase [Herbiconiux sp.]|uniref:SDR family oxidoreductase n=1 Tax=Herbiconiux sp. TaxID=1871186 RepID=UPI0025C63321|nr:SDR family oxidoreductase [Herbiconiux sp.]